MSSQTAGYGPYVESRPALSAPDRLYPLQRPLLVVGLIAGVLALVAQGWLVGLAVFMLFALVGAIWRADMLPILPACVAFQWLSASACYLYFRSFGRVPGGGFSEALPQGLVLSMVGLAALVVGLRVGLSLFRGAILPKTLSAPVAYDINKVFLLTLGLFAASYTVNILPKQIWFGGAQIIENLLALRFVPFFLLLVTVFERRSGYAYVIAATAWVLGPQLLTGFSNFKEIMFVIIVAALAQWRPWVRTLEQRRQNRRMLTFGLIGAVAVAMAGIVWSGGVKQQWRQVVWQESAQASPITKIGLFFNVVGDVVSDLDVGRGAEQLAARFSSGALYLSYVVTRVPSVVPHEHGVLFSRAIANATQPRFLNPDKVNLGGDSWLVRRYAGIAAAGDEAGASIGLGYLAEFYIDYGWAGVIGLAALWGVICSAALALLARASPSREVFLALMVGLLTQYLMVFDGSFIKLLAGLIQRTLVAAVVIAIAGPPIQRWLISAVPVRRPRPLLPRSV